MSERERWIVYPLLFLALGVALRDKLSEQTRTRRIECQELIVLADENVGRDQVPLVRIGAVERATADAPYVGQIIVNGGIEARAINADSYYFRRVPFAPTLLRAIPGMLSPEWLQALQQHAQAAAEAAAAQPSPPQQEPAPPATKSEEQ